MVTSQSCQSQSVIELRCWVADPARSAALTEPKQTLRECVGLILVFAVGEKREFVLERFDPVRLTRDPNFACLDLCAAGDREVAWQNWTVG